MRCFVAIMVMIVGFQAFIYWPVRTSPVGAAYEWRSLQEKKEFHRLLKKHGLHRQITVIFRDGSREYYLNRRGQRCPFI